MGFTASAANSPGNRVTRLLAAISSAVLCNLGNYMNRGATILTDGMSDFSEGGDVVRAQGLDSEVTRKSEASLPDEGLPAPEGALAERRDTAAPPQRPQDSTQTVSDNFHDS